MVPSFFQKVIPDAEAARMRPKKEAEIIEVDHKMLQLLKSFRASRLGSKKGGLHLLKKNSKKRRRAEFEAQHELSTSIQEAMR